MKLGVLSPKIRSCRCRAVREVLSWTSWHNNSAVGAITWGVERRRDGAPGHGAYGMGIGVGGWAAFARWQRLRRLQRLSTEAKITGDGDGRGGRKL